MRWRVILASDGLAVNATTSPGCIHAIRVGRSPMLIDGDWRAHDRWKSLANTGASGPSRGFTPPVRLSVGDTSYLPGA